MDRRIDRRVYELYGLTGERIRIVQTDMCFCRTTAGYQNLARDFNGFLVGDATLVSTRYSGPRV